MQEEYNKAGIITPDNLAEAFRNYHNPLALGSQPLAFLATVRARQAHLEAEGGQHGRSAAQWRGLALAAELKDLIATLDPGDSSPPSSRSGRFPYELLNQTVILGRSATEVASRLFISRSQLYRIRKKALEDLCLLWQEREAAIAGVKKPEDNLPRPKVQSEKLPILPYRSGGTFPDYMRRAVAWANSLKWPKNKSPFLQKGD